MVTNYFIVPGLGNSGPQHWQTWLQHTAPNYRRIDQQEWDAPDCEDWVQTIDEAIAPFDLSTVVLIGHSLGCATITHWANRYSKKIRGAMLVAPSDLEAPAYTFPATGFSPIPLQRLNFKSVVVASANDPWVSLERASLFASNWGSQLINIGDAGHINADAGFGPWPQGLKIAKSI